MRVPIDGRKTLAFDRVRRRGVDTKGHAGRPPRAFGVRCAGPAAAVRLQRRRPLPATAVELREAVTFRWKAFRDQTAAAEKPASGPRIFGGFRRMRGPD